MIRRDIARIFKLVLFSTRWRKSMRKSKSITQRLKREKNTYVLQDTNEF
jgi:hypothetical protein